MIPLAAPIPSEYISNNEVMFVLLLDVGKTQLLESSILETIANFMGRDDNENIQETLLELLTNLAENGQLGL